MGVSLGHPPREVRGEGQHNAVASAQLVERELFPFALPGPYGYDETKRTKLNTRIRYPGNHSGDRTPNSVQFLEPVA